MEWLRSLSVEDSIAIFEDLCAGIPELADQDRAADPPPPVLASIWKRA